MSLQRFIDDCINNAVKVGTDYGKTLDFSDESVMRVGDILDLYHDRYLHPEKDNGFITEHIDTFAHVFGIYVSEVFRRNHAQNWRWQETEYGRA